MTEPQPEKTSPANESLESVYQIGLQAKKDGNLALAMQSFQKCIEARPKNPMYHMQMAAVVTAMSRPYEQMLNLALYHAQEAAKIDPTILGHWLAMGEIALAANKWPEGIAAYETAISMEPDQAFIWALLGFAHTRNGEHDLSRDACERAIKLDPDCGTAHFILSSYYYTERFDPAKVAHHGERAFECKKPTPLKLEAMWNSAHGFLSVGNYPKGFTYFEARLMANLTNVNQRLPLDRNPGKPLWRGKKGIRVLVSAEMGLGDSVCMVRYLPLIKTKFDCDVVFECHGNMLDLMRYNFPEITCVKYGEVDQASFDEQIPIMSLPLVFETTRESVPNDPYIRAEPEKIAHWREYLHGKSPAPNGPWIGICWHAGKNSWSADNHSTSNRKSLSFEQIEPILAVDRINFVSLQTERDQQFKNPGIKDFSDTAALIELMDVVVTVDTAVANLAGAMGKETWVLNRFDQCWRYVSVPTLWYPTAKSYRQPAPKDWNPVLEQVWMDLLKIRDRIAA